MDEAEDDVFAYFAFPKKNWPLLHPTNSLERFIGGIRRRTDAVAIFPSEGPIVG